MAAVSLWRREARSSANAVLQSSPGHARRVPPPNRASHSEAHDRAPPGQPPRRRACFVANPQSRSSWLISAPTAARAGGGCWWQASGGSSKQSRARSRLPDCARTGSTAHVAGAATQEKPRCWSPEGVRILVEPLAVKADHHLVRVGAVVGVDCEAPGMPRSIATTVDVARTISDHETGGQPGRARQRDPL
jgi:hypothetical protein